MAPSNLQTIAQAFNLHHNLASLPPEILSHIRICLRELDDPYHDEPYNYDYAPNTSFPLVCRRFRNLEVSIPSLWTLLSDTMTSDRINLHMARSGALGLKVQLFIDGRTACICEKWRLLTQSSHRWSLLTVNACRQQHNCFSTLRDLSLPSLWSLDIAYLDDDVIPILSTWTIPSVRTVYLLELSALLALPLTQSLTTLRLIHASDVPGADRLLDFLASAPQLTNLHLTLERVNMQGGLPMQDKKLSLPMLHDLSLQCMFIEEEVSQFMQYIAMPNIRFVKLGLYIGVADNDALIDWLPTLRNPSLRTVTVEVLGDLDGTTRGRIINAFQANNGGLFRVDASIDDRGTLVVNIEFA